MKERKEPVGVAALVGRVIRSRFVAVLFAVLAVSMVASPFGAATASVVAGFWPADSAGLAVVAAPDDSVIHQREEVFQRHGPAADEIAQWDGLGALPERFIREVWVLVDSESNVRASITEIRSLSGELLQRVTVGPAEVITEAPGSGGVERDTAPKDKGVVKAPATLFAEGWAHYEAEVDAGSATVTRMNGPGEGAIELVSELVKTPEQPVTTTRTSDGDLDVQPATTVPYVGDLTILSAERRIAFDAETRRPLSQEIVAKTSAGTEVVLESTTWPVWESLPGSAWHSVAEAVALGRES